MGLFRKKKIKKQEQINIIFNDEVNDDFVIESKIETKKEVIVNEKSNDELEKEIVSKYNFINSKNNRIIKEYFTCKILSRIGLRDLDFNLQVVAMDKHINRVKKDCYELQKVVEKINLGLSFDSVELIKVNKQLDDLKAYQKGLLSQLNEVNNTSYGNLKISTVSVTLNKTNEELENLYNNISLELKGFKSFEEAAEYIFYQSGNFIDDLVERFLTYIKGTGNKEYIAMYNKLYFLNSDTVISLDIKEWVDLYNKLKFVLKLIGNYDNNAYLKYHELFDSFEAKYAILMMRTEGINK